MLSIYIAAGFAAVIFAGNYIYDRQNNNPHDWKRGLIMAAVSATLIILIGAITE